MRFAIAMAAVLAVPTTTQAATVFSDGFELPVVSGPCCITVAAGGVLPGWNVTDGDVNVVNGTFASASGGNLAYEGLQYLDLIGESGAGAISSIAFATTIGQTYALTFAYSHNLFSGLSSASADLSVGDYSGSITHSGGSNSDLNWVLATINFTAISGVSTLKFKNTAGDSASGIFLDAINVTSVDAVPEPATWSMMLLGFGVAGYALRRRRISVAFSKRVAQAALA